MNQKVFNEHVLYAYVVDEQSSRVIPPDETCCSMCKTLLFIVVRE